MKFWLSTFLKWNAVLIIHLPFVLVTIIHDWVRNKQAFFDSKPVKKNCWSIRKLVEENSFESNWKQLKGLYHTAGFSIFLSTLPIAYPLSLNVSEKIIVWTKTYFRDDIPSKHSIES